jgi:hypothetical protein
MKKITKIKLTVEEFDALPKNEKAVLVAKDVLAQIKAKNYIPNTGSYVKPAEYVNKIKDLGVKKGDDVRTNFDKLPVCKVCALGSMLLSCTRLGNRLTFGNLNFGDGSTGTSIRELDNPKVKKLFKSIFDGYQLLLIENSFESPSWSQDRYGSDVLGLSLTDEDYSNCREFYLRYSNDDTRMVAICKNIIKNKGTFKL